MKQLQVPEFEGYSKEAEFWDNLDTADFMADDGEWFHFNTPHKRAVRVAILPAIAEDLIHNAQTQRVSIETLVNVPLVSALES